MPSISVRLRQVLPERILAIQHVKVIFEKLTVENIVNLGNHVRIGIQCDRAVEQPRAVPCQQIRAVSSASQML